MNQLHNAYNAFAFGERLCRLNPVSGGIWLSFPSRLFGPVVLVMLTFFTGSQPLRPATAQDSSDPAPKFSIATEADDQTAEAAADDAETTDQDAIEDGSEEDVSEDQVSDLEAARLIAKLASPKFADREHAVEEIVEIGMPMVPHLRRAIAKADDPELKQRATTALVHLTSGHFEAKVADFLQFKNDGSSFEGWLTVSAVMGDTQAVRDMFIQILRAHPNVITALDGTTRDRNLAMEQAAQTIQTNMFQRHIFPSLADGISLLLPLSDPDVVFSLGCESTLISVLQKHMAVLRQDAGLNGPVSKLLDEWIARSRVELRSDALWWAMQWDIQSGATLGVRTLSETTDTETLQVAFQAIARFGKKDDAKLLSKYVRDPRPAVTTMPSMVEQEMVQTTLGDVAMVAIAVLHQKPIKDLGMPLVETHPTIAFLIDSIGYPVSKSSLRTKAQALAESWVSGIAIPENQGS